MPEIPEIEIRNIIINDIPDLPDILKSPAQIKNIDPPVTVTIGSPIVNVPGCVKARESNNKQLFEDDPNGNMILCDGQVPSYEPLDYNPNQLIYTQPAKRPEYKPTEDVLPPPTPAIPNTNIPIPSCPEDEEYNEELKICEKKEVIEVEDEPSWIETYLPEPAEVATTATVALTAATAALVAKPIADLLLKLIKPAIKKVMKKVSEYRGIEEVPMSVQERRQYQREVIAAQSALKKALGKK